MQKATAIQAAQQAPQAKSKALKLKQATQATPRLADSQCGSNTTQGSVEADMNEREVDITNAAEIFISNK